MLYADRNIVASDLARTEGSKIYRRDLPEGSVAIANATDDAIAGEGLAHRILDEVTRTQSRDPPKITEAIRRQLQNWSKAYQKEKQPSIQSLIVFGHSGHTYLYLLQPPNTVIPKDRYSIGSGARVTDSMLKALAPDGLELSPRETLLHLAYMTRHAKQQEALVGGIGWTGSDAVYVPSSGSTVPIESIELGFAEELAPSMDEFLTLSLHAMMGCLSSIELDKMADRLRGLLVTIANSVTRRATFSALDDGPSK